MSGQHNNSLFAGIDGSQLKTFSLEVDCHRAEDALFAFEKAIRELKLGQRQFGYGNDSGVRVRYSYPHRPHCAAKGLYWDEEDNSRGLINHYYLPFQMR